MKTLHLPLKKEWYNLIESGVKTEEYREIKPYWIYRFCSYRIMCGDCKLERNSSECKKCFDEGHYTLYPFDKVRFSYGYTRRTMTFQVKEACYGKGNPSWGAPEEENVFIIKLGKRIE